MAMLLRRAYFARSFYTFPNTRFFTNLSHLSPFDSHQTPQSSAPLFRKQRDFIRLEFGFLTKHRRGFAKGKKSKDDGGRIEVVPDTGPTVKATALGQMEAAIVALSRELSKLRTGRASPGMLDHIMVETNGVKMPLNRVAVVSILDSQSLAIMPYDTNVQRYLQDLHTRMSLRNDIKPKGNKIGAFKPTYHLGKERMIGSQALFFHQREYHSKLEKLVFTSFIPSAIRGSAFEIEWIVQKLLP